MTKRQLTISRRRLIKSAAVGGFVLVATSIGVGPVLAADVKLVLWDYQQTPNPAYLKRLADYTAATGVAVERVTIKYEDFLGKILQGAAANALPDVILIDNPWNSAMADQGVLADITDKVKAWDRFDQFYPGPKASAVWKDRIYGVPNESNCLIMYYNKDMFDAAGLQPPKNWDELRDTAKKLTKKGEVYGLSTSMMKSENAVFVFESLLWQAGADLNSLNSPEALKAMNFLVDLVKDGSLSPESLNWDLRAGVTQLVNGRSAMAFDGTWDAPWVRDNMKAKWDVALLPAGPAGSASNLGGENWSITSTTQHPDEAWNLIEYVNEPDRLLPDLIASGQLPSRRDIADRPEFKVHPIDTAIEQLAVARARVYGPNYPEMANALMLAFQTAISGQATPQQALETAAATITPLLATP